MASWRSMTKIARSASGSNSQRHGFAYPDPHQNVKDPKHWFWASRNFSVMRNRIQGFTRMRNRIKLTKIILFRTSNLALRFTNDTGSSSKAEFPHLNCKSCVLLHQFCEVVEAGSDGHCYKAYLQDRGDPRQQVQEPHLWNRTPKSSIKFIIEHLREKGNILRKTKMVSIYKGGEQELVGWMFRRRRGGGRPSWGRRAPWPRRGRIPGWRRRTAAASGSGS